MMLEQPGLRYRKKQDIHHTPSLRKEAVADVYLPNIFPGNIINDQIPATAGGAYPVMN